MPKTGLSAGSKTTITAIISGQSITGSFTASVSGQPVKVSGETVSLPSTQVVKISGETLSLPSTQVVKVSGESLVVTSGQVVAKVSGETVVVTSGLVVAKISGESLVVTSGQVVAKVSGETYYMLAGGHSRAVISGAVIKNVTNVAAVLHTVVINRGTSGYACRIRDATSGATGVIIAEPYCGAAATNPSALIFDCTMLSGIVVDTSGTAWNLTVNYR